MQIFKFQRRSCKLSFLFPPRRQNATESLLVGQFKVPRRRQRSKRPFLIKSPLAFFQTVSRLLQVAYFFKCRQTHRGKKFVFVCLRPQQNVKLCIFTSWLCSSGKEMLIKLTTRYACKVVDLLIKLIDWPYCASPSTQIIAGRTVQHVDYLVVFYVLRTPVYI